MSNKKLAVILLVVAVVVVAGFGLYKLTEGDDSSEDQIVSVTEAEAQSTSDDAQPSNEVQVVLTKEEVAKHSTKTDCWTIIEGNVYDLTSFIPGHPGGDEILRACGIDGTTLFTQRTTSSGEEVGSGTSHSRSAESQLEELRLGPLQQ